MIFEDIANVMNARPVKEIMRKTGLTKNRVYSLRMGCTFHMDYELLFALQRMGYEVRVFAVGDPARQSRDGNGKIPAPVGPVTARAVSRSEMEPNGDKRRGFAVGDPARRSRDGTAKGRCGVAKPWPRSGQTAPGRFARRNAAPDFAQKPSKPGRPARCPHGPRYGPAGVHRMFLRPPLGLPFSSWRQLRTKMRTISSTS